MKPNTLYNSILVLALAATGLMVYYNLALRETFPVTVGYRLPEPAPAVQEKEPASVIDADEREEPAYIYDDYIPDDPDPVVLVSFPLELNSAAYDELMYIPRIGTVMAQRIVQYRDHLGGYTALEQLKEVSGIGDATFDIIAPYLYLEGEWTPEEKTGEGSAAAQE